MKKRSKVLVILLAGMFIMPAYSIVFAGEFQHRADLLKSAENEHLYKRVLLTPAVYNDAKPDLSDIRIINQDGKEIPYFIMESESSGDALHSQYQTELVDQFDEGKYTYLDFKAIGIKEGEEIQVDSLELKADAQDFAKKIEVFCSTDGVAWESVTDAAVYKISGIGQMLTIDFQEKQTDHYYRLKYLYDEEKVNFSEITLMDMEKRSDADDFVQSLNPPFEIENEDGETTVIVRDAVKNLNLRKIKFEASGSFKGIISCAGHQGVLYNLEYGDVPIQRLEIGMRGIQPGEELVMIIESDDKKPVNIKSVTIEYEVCALTFSARPKDLYMLFFGDESRMAPTYDTENLEKKVMNSGFDEWSIGDVKTPLIAPEEEPKDDKDVWPVVIALGIIAIPPLGIKIIAKYRK